MKIIKDIRIYRSQIENVDYNSLPIGFNHTSLNPIIHRIVMKLRESGFSLGEFDHLYLNFTTCAVDGNISLSKRGVDKYHPWYRYYDINVSSDFYSNLEKDTSIDEVIRLLKQVLIQCFSTENFDKNFIELCFSHVLEQGKDMKVVYKEKSTAQRKAVIYLTYLDNCKYLPILKVFNIHDNLLFESTLIESHDLNYLGIIQLSNKKVSIKPRKNSYKTLTQPLSFEY